MQLNVKKLNPEAILPSYAREGDAGLDLFAAAQVGDRAGQIRARANRHRDRTAVGDGGAGSSAERARAETLPDGLEHTGNGR